MLSRATAVVLAIGVCATGAFSASGSQTAAANADVDALLRRAGDYVRGFEQDFSTVISDEAYRQRAERVRSAVNTGTGRNSGRATTMTLSSDNRAIESEMLFTWLPDERSWLAVRNAVKVDRREIAGSTDRLTRALSDPARLSRLRQLADEGARFNIGTIFRNFNDPTFVLRFLDPALQPRFAFSLSRKETIRHALAWKIAFVERERPALTQSSSGNDLPASGSVWLNAANGAVVKTSVALHDIRTGMSAQIAVDFDPNPALGFAPPSQMTESYSQVAGDVEERITCLATYTNFRRFSTSGRIIQPN